MISTTTRSAKRNDIPLYRLMDNQACMRADGEPYAYYAAQAMRDRQVRRVAGRSRDRRDQSRADEYRGLDRFEARKRIVDAINADGLAVTWQDEDGNAVPYVENKKIMQPFGDRSGVVIEPMLTDQWYRRRRRRWRKPAIASVREGRTKFVPKNWEKTYFDWMENIQPWCISRQLWWGHQIPAWYGPDGTSLRREDGRRGARRRHRVLPRA